MVSIYLVCHIQSCSNILNTAWSFHLLHSYIFVLKARVYILYTKQFSVSSAHQITFWTKSTSSNKIHSILSSWQERCNLKVVCEVSSSHSCGEACVISKRSTYLSTSRTTHCASTRHTKEQSLMSVRIDTMSVRIETIWCSRLQNTTVRTILNRQHTIWRQWQEVMLCNIFSG